MAHDELIAYFLERYLPRDEVVYRLPVSVSMESFWPELLAARRSRMVILPLPAENGAFYGYVPTPRFLAAGDRIAALARVEALSESPTFRTEAGVMDEAYFSSVIEGAYTTRQEAHALLSAHTAPQNRSEQMILNNYAALRFVLEHLDGPINEAVVLEIARLLTEGTLDSEEKHGYRDKGVQVVSGTQEVVYTAPPAESIRPMMDALLAYINDPTVHPIVKACVAHIDFVTIHPLFDGNGRTARALAYMILLKAGYGFFRQFPISGLLAQERSRYYKAIRASQNPENGADFTYFMEYYADMLSRSLEDVHAHLALFKRLHVLEQRLEGSASGARILQGAAWMVNERVESITADKWRGKFKVSFETARQDLQRLEQEGFVTLRVVGRKHHYDLVHPA